MSVYETDIPGVGRKFELELAGGGRAVALVHHDGRAELFYREHADADAEKLLDLTSDEANRLGSILEGAYFESVDVDALSVPLGGDIIEWTEIEEWSPLAEATLRTADVRARTGVSVIAVQRGTETIANPDPECELRAGDLLVSVGSREQQNALGALVAGEDGD